MAAPAPPPDALLAALQAVGLATQADLAPLATQAQVGALQAQMQAQHAAMQAQMQAQFAALQAQLAQLGVPAMAAAASATVQAIASARARNAHDRRGEAYVVVPRADGTPPPNWPANFNRAALRGNIAVIDALLVDYGLPHPAGVLDRRDLLAQHIGTMRL